MVTESELFYLVFLTLFVLILNLFMTRGSKRDGKAHP